MTIATDTTRSRPPSTTPTVRARAAGRRPRLRARAARLVDEHGVRLVVPLTDLDQLVLARARRARAARPAAAAPRSSSGWATSTSRTRPSNASGSPRRRAGSEELPDDALPAARQGPRRLRLAPHLPGRDREELDFHLDTRRCLVRASVLPRRGVLDRRLLRLRRPLPERDPADDDRVEGRRVDQGDDDQGLGPDRARAPGRRGARDLRARRTSSASASATARSSSPTSTRASAAPSRCRTRRAAATRSWRSRSANGERPEPRVGEFREGVVMTRFFSH